VFLAAGMEAAYVSFYAVCLSAVEADVSYSIQCRQRCRAGLCLTWRHGREQPEDADEERHGYLSQSGADRCTGITVVLGGDEFRHPDAGRRGTADHRCGIGWGDQFHRHRQRL